MSWPRDNSTAVSPPAHYFPDWGIVSQKSLSDSPQPHRIFALTTPFCWDPSQDLHKVILQRQLGSPSTALSHFN